MRKPPTEKAPKVVMVKTFGSMDHLIRAIPKKVQQEPLDLMISILGKVTTPSLPDKKLSKYLFDGNYGEFTHPVFGQLFVAGPAAPLFLHDLEGQKLGEMSGGPYGILRGLGIPKEKVENCLNDLRRNQYLLLSEGTLEHLLKFPAILP